MEYGHKTFHRHHTGLKSGRSRQRIIDEVTQEVTDWLNGRSGAIEVLHMDFEVQDFSSHAVVWYRHLKPDMSAPPLAGR